MKPSPLKKAVASAVSVCGKILKKGQSILVPETAVGVRERTMERRGRIAVRPSNKKGHVQIVAEK